MSESKEGQRQLEVLSRCRCRLEKRRKIERSTNRRMKSPDRGRTKGGKCNLRNELPPGLPIWPEALFQKTTIMNKEPLSQLSADAQAATPFKLKQIIIEGKIIH